MIASILMMAALLFGLAGIPDRAHLVRNPERSDADVRRFDAVMAGVLAVLLAGAAIVAALSTVVTGVGLAAAQIIAVFVAGATGGYFVRTALSMGGIPTRSENYDDPDGEPLLRGGRIIGVLERTAIAVCLLVGWPAGLAVILGVKGLARFPQLREHHASEQFIIGTFASVLWACAAAGIGHLVGV
ncbi:MAG TPA: hypothetical protein PK331_12140 [Gordonia sp. (in: high G+C Gram-positive bacteria)]|uniref:hypothetical protein n=1 Tax=unclassified Gordonia (in: high G+C Gram-positive bacteria) TaxID=2657482 RepID=UPI000F9FC61F|nr:MULTISPECIES: hypothetical protein [unclassified Gordonia (in: high G+C Gram-positive bacteria)]RUP39865.1 MAG: hypothetical protein EKK60_05670 [Gordonia sp. (in: high G+C Gram-positive bacteria)]HNP56715.1 hypothetical protein [Gordonia sp. (in: high G+C Gram-positive bacteria)]HRC51654.1 hypothetical protein [Gordonia sp. (in: high G+C Gram-positive bacteria)]